MASFFGFFLSEVMMLSMDNQPAAMNPNQRIKNMGVMTLKQTGGLFRSI